MICHRRLLVVILSLSGFFLQSCDEDFSPKAPFEQKLIVFSLLSAAQDTQYIQVARTYDVEGFDPFQNREAPDVTDAEVKVITDDGSVILFQDTAIRRENDERYGIDGHAFVAGQFRVLPRMNYQLEVRSPTYGVARASFQTPDAIGIGHLADRNTGDFTVRAASFGAKGFLIRLYVVFIQDQDGNLVELAVEVPRSILNDGTRIYPDVDRLSIRSFSGGVLAAVRAEVITSDTTDSVKEIGMRIIVWSLEPNAYNYYQVSRGFNDRFSVRLDVPDFTNIEGGFGVFGGLLVDTLFVRSL